MRSRSLAGACALALAGAVTMAATPPRGFYSASAAEEGARLYAERCAMCHGAALEGTHEVPGLTGKFVANWAGRPLGDLPAYLTRAMPQFAPGSLQPDEAAHLAAFLLRSNGYPAIDTAAAGTGSVPATELLPAPPRAVR